MPTKLGLALKRAFPGADGPRRVLRRLGLDADLLQSMPSMPSSGSHDVPHAMRTELERLLDEFSHELGSAKVEKFLEVLDRHAPFDRARGGAGDDEHHMHRGDEEEDERHERLRRFLKEKGLSEDAIGHAVAMIPAMPRNGTEGGMGGRTPQVAPRDRISGSDRHHSMAAMDSFFRRFPGSEAIEVGAPGGSMAMDRRPRPPTAAEIEAFEARFPDAKRLAPQ